MNADQYLVNILQRETVVISGPTASAPAVFNVLRPKIVEWALQNGSRKFTRAAHMPKERR